MDLQRDPQEGTDTTVERGRVQEDPGEDLGERVLVTTRNYAWD